MGKLRVNLNGVVKEGLGVDIKDFRTEEISLGINKLIVSYEILDYMDLLRYYLNAIKSTSVILTPSVDVSRNYMELINEFGLTLPKIYPINSDVYMYINLLDISNKYEAEVGFNSVKAEYPKTTKMVILDNGNILPTNKLDTILNNQFKEFLKRKNVNSEIDFKIMAKVSCEAESISTIPFSIKEYIDNKISFIDYRDYIKSVYPSFNLGPDNSFDGVISGHIGKFDNELSISIHELTKGYYISVFGKQYDSEKEFGTMNELLDFFGKIVNKYEAILEAIDDFNKFIE